MQAIEPRSTARGKDRHPFLLGIPCHSSHRPAQHKPAPRRRRRLLYRQAKARSAARPRRVLRSQKIVREPVRNDTLAIPAAHDRTQTALSEAARFIPVWRITGAPRREPVREHAARTISPQMDRPEIRNRTLGNASAAIFGISEVDDLRQLRLNYGGPSVETYARK